MNYVKPLFPKFHVYFFIEKKKQNNIRILNQRKKIINLNVIYVYDRDTINIYIRQPKN